MKNIWGEKVNVESVQKGTQSFFPFKIRDFKPKEGKDGGVRQYSTVFHLNINVFQTKREDKD